MPITCSVTIMRGASGMPQTLNKAYFLQPIDQAKESMNQETIKPSLTCCFVGMFVLNFATCFTTSSIMVSLECSY